MGYRYYSTSEKKSNRQERTGGPPVRSWGIQVWWLYSRSETATLNDTNRVWCRARMGGAQHCPNSIPNTAWA